MPTDTVVNNLVINKLTKAQYDGITTKSGTELYLVPDEIDSTPTSGSENPVTSGGIYTALSGKQDTIDSSHKLSADLIESGTNNKVFSSMDQSKLGSIAFGAEVNVLSNWNETDTTSKAYIQNKPTIPAAQIQADWNQTTTTALDYIKNKPTGEDYVSTINGYLEDESNEGNDVSITNHNGCDIIFSESDLTLTNGTSSIATDGANDRIKIQTNSDESYIKLDNNGINMVDTINNHLQFNGEDIAFTSELGTKIYYGTCTTGASTNPKVCTVETFPTITLTVDNVEVTTPKVGTVIAVKFSNTNSSTSTSPQLNVNSLGGKRIYYNAAVLSDSKSIWAGYAARINYYMWDGTYWVVLSNSIGNSNTTYSEISTSEAASTSSSTARLITGRRLNAFAKINNGVITIGSNSLDTQIPIEAPVDSTDPTEPLTTLTCTVGKYYRLDVPVESLDITLPSITDTTHVLNIVINLTTSNRFDSIDFVPPSGVTVSYHSGYSIEKDTEYELNLQFNGIKWIVSYAVVE